VIASSFLHLPGVLEPLLILRVLLPALIGRAGADQLHVGAEVPPVLAGAVAGAVGAQAEVLRGEALGGGSRPRDEVAALKTDLAFYRAGVFVAPKPVPIGEILAALAPRDCQSATNWSMGVPVR
jgi:hypothetical protein